MPAKPDGRKSVMLRVTPEAKRRLRLYAVQRGYELGKSVSYNAAAEELFLRAPVKKRKSRAA